MRRCKYGKLKHKAGGRVCKRRRSSAAARSCPNGRLKRPIGNRKCRKMTLAQRVARRYRRESRAGRRQHATESSYVTAHHWEGYRRRRHSRR